MSQPFAIDRKDGLHILKVLGYSVASAVVAGAISFLSTAKFEPQYLALIPIVNSLLVGIQRYLENREA